MDDAMVHRSLGLAGVLAAMVLLAGCASTRDGTSGGLPAPTPPPSPSPLPSASPPPPRPPGTEYEFFFVAEPVLASGSTVNIVVAPATATDGLYEGGNARIESKSASERNTVVWKSTRPFWIRFESMKSNKGNGGDRFGPEDFTASTASGTAPPTFSYRLELKPGNVRNAYSAKYFVTFGPLDPADPKKKSLGFVLDPVIIVDR